MSVISPFHVTYTKLYQERAWKNDVKQGHHQNQDKCLVCLLVILSKHKGGLQTQLKHKKADSNNKILLK
jgi:hypothetical protein